MNHAASQPELPTRTQAARHSNAETNLQAAAQLPETLSTNHSRRASFGRLIAIERIDISEFCA
jgi:hypothetical protein